jgi:hypothetical protein
MKKGETVDKAPAKERLRDRKCPYRGADKKRFSAW